MYSFAIQRITWKNCLGILFLENLISVTQKNVIEFIRAMIFAAGVTQFTGPQLATHCWKERRWELRNIYHHHPESEQWKSWEANSGSIHPYGRYGNAVKARKSICTIVILWLVKAIFEKRAATVEVDTLFSLENQTEKSTHHPRKIDNQHRECKIGGGAYFAFFLGSDNQEFSGTPNPW